MEERKIKWAPTMEEEFKKNFEPLESESILSQARGFAYFYFYKLPVMFTLTNKRLIILKHRPLSLDTFLYVNINEIKDIKSGTTTMFLGLGKRYSVMLISLENANRLVIGITGKSLISRDIGKYIGHGLIAALAGTPAVAGAAVAAEPSSVSNKKYMEMINELIKNNQ